MSEITKAVIISRDDEITTVVGSGELDLSVAQEFRAAITDAATSSEQVIIDLRAASFIDSAILQCLVEAGIAQLKSTSERLKLLISPGSHPQYVLKTVGFQDFLDIVVEDKEQ